MQTKYRYEIIMYWSDEDEAYIAEVPELAGCVADGPTYQEALAQAEIVIGEWIENSKRIGPADSRTSWAFALRMIARLPAAVRAPLATGFTWPRWNVAS